MSALLLTSSTGCWRPQANAGPGALPSSHRGLPGSREDFPMAGGALRVTTDGPSPGSVTVVGTSTDAEGQSSFSEIDVVRSADEVQRPRRPPPPGEEQRRYMDALVPRAGGLCESDHAECTPAIDGRLPAP